MGNWGSHPGSLPQEYTAFTIEPLGYPGVEVAQVWTKYGDQVTATDNLDGRLLRALKHWVWSDTEHLIYVRSFHSHTTLRGGHYYGHTEIFGGLLKVTKPLGDETGTSTLVSVSDSKAIFFHSIDQSGQM